MARVRFRRTRTSNATRQKSAVALLSMFRLTISLASLSMTRSAKGSDVTRFCPRLPDMLCPSAVNKMLTAAVPTFTLLMTLLKVTALAL